MPNFFPESLFDFQKKVIINFPFKINLPNLTKNFVQIFLMLKFMYKGTAKLNFCFRTILYGNLTLLNVSFTHEIFFVKSLN